MLDAAHGLALATAPLDEQITGAYMLNVLVAAQIVSGSDRETAPFAAVWELGRFIQETLGEEQNPHVQSRGVSCGHEECQLNHASELAVTEAAIRGDGEALIGVCKAAMREGIRLGNPNPELVVMKLYVSTLINVCLSLIRD